MLRDLRDISSDETDCDADCRDGRPQENIVFGHVLGVMATQSNGVLAAFSSVLTHFLGSAISGGVPDIQGHEFSIAREMRAPIRMQIGRPSRAKIPLRPFSEVGKG